MTEITNSEQLLSEKLSLMQMDNVTVSRFARLRSSVLSGCTEAQWRPQGINAFNFVFIPPPDVAPGNTFVILCISEADEDEIMIIRRFWWKSGVSHHHFYQMAKRISAAYKTTETILYILTLTKCNCI